MDRQDHQPRFPHFHSQGQGSTPNLSHKKQMSGCWKYSIMGNATFTDSMINLTSCYPTPETLRQLFILCVIQTAGLPDVAFPLCSNLCWVKHCRTGENSSLPETFKHFVHSHICQCTTQSVLTFQFGFVFTVTNLGIVTQEFIIILFLLLVWMVH